MSDAPSRSSAAGWDAGLLRPTPAAAPRAAARPAETLYSLHPRKIWRYLKTQPASFWLINVYLFFEYVRPQQIYTSILGPPYAQIIIFMALGAFLLEGKSVHLRTPADSLILAFAAVVLVSSVTALYPSYSFSRFSLFYSWLLIYFLIANIVTTEKRFLVFSLAWLLYNFKMSQHGTRTWASVGFGYSSWGVTGAPGWFQNSGEFGIEMTMYFPMTIYFMQGVRKHIGRKTRLLFYAMLITTVAGTLGSNSRGAMIGLAAVALYMLLRSRHKVKGLLGLAVVGIVAVLAIPPETWDRFHTMGDDKTSVSRKEYWRFGLDLLHNHPVLGIGYENWLPNWQATFGTKALPHNIFIQAGAELGYIGLLAFVALIVATFVVNHRTLRLARRLRDDGTFMANMALGLDAALVGYLVSGFFVTVLYYPFFWINLAMTVGLHRAVRRAYREARQRAAAAAWSGSG